MFANFSGDRLFRQIQQDFKLFLYLWLLFSMLRLGFIGVMHVALTGNYATELLQALYYGARISLKSAGALAFLSFLFITLPGVFLYPNKTDRLRKQYGYACITALIFLFFVRIPYYEAFHAAFDQFLFNTFNDDVSALTVTIFEQYPVIRYFLLVLLLSLFTGLLFKRWLAVKTLPWPQFNHRVFTGLFGAILVLLVMTFMVFVRFGGSLTYSKSIHWENAAMLGNDMLNEAILDDIQALYRAYSSYERIKEATGPVLRKETVQTAALRLSDQPSGSQELKEALSRKAQGPLIPKPKHIFIILGETYSQWPLLDQYQDLHLVDEMKELLSRENSLWVKNFIPASSGTIGAINTVVTGLPEVNLSINYQPRTYQEQYITSLAPQLKKLGYHTAFWYGGFGSWQKIRDFTLAQGFERFYSYSDLPKVQGGNAWGTEDKYIFQAMQDKMDDNEPTVDVVMTVSNHPPYTVDVEKEGFPRELVRQALSDSQKNDQELLTKLGHIWYANHVICQFIDSVSKSHPESLFIITGDHANRFNIEPNPSIVERYTIPFILYGSGIKKNLIPDQAAGQQLNIVPTLMELIAPKDFVYYSIGRSLTLGNDWAANHELWVKEKDIGWLKQKTDNDPTEQNSEAQRAMAWWLVQKGL